MASDRTGYPEPPAPWAGRDPSTRSAWVFTSAADDPPGPAVSFDLPG